MVQKLTSGERQTALVILVCVVVAGLAMAAAGGSDPLGVHGVWVNGRQVADAKGPYNDQRGPYLKFGVYKPTGWTQGGPYTVSYRNISVVTGED